MNDPTTILAQPPKTGKRAKRTTIHTYRIIMYEFYQPQDMVVKVSQQRENVT